MSDSYWGRIMIGGRLPQKDVEEFLEVIHKECLPDRPKTEQDLRKMLVDNEYLEMSDGEASNGMFEDLENWCMKHDLTYQRNSDACGDESAEEVYWAPGMRGPIFNKTDQNNDVVIDREEILQYIEDLRKYLKKAPTVEKAPLHINSGRHSFIYYATEILKAKKVDPLTLLENNIKRLHPISGDVPPLEIV